MRPPIAMQPSTVAGRTDDMVDLVEVEEGEGGEEGVSRSLQL